MGGEGKRREVVDGMFLEGWGLINDDLVCRSIQYGQFDSSNLHEEFPGG